MRKVAEHYLASRRAGDFNLRFDIVSVVIRPGEGPQVKHIPGAF
jgi:Holliday junction resolvase-like predicted endonuclease